MILFHREICTDLCIHMLLVMFDNAADLPKSTTEEGRQLNIKASSMQSSDLKNPCLVEQKLSYRCLSENNYDKTACEIVFANYNACKDFWGRVQKDRRIQGIRPLLPPPEDREKIKQEYLLKWDPNSKLNRN